MGKVFNIKVSLEKTLKKWDQVMLETWKIKIEVNQFKHIGNKITRCTLSLFREPTAGGAVTSMSENFFVHLVVHLLKVFFIK